MANAIVGVNSRIVRGWRTSAIERCLDFCAQVEGYTQVLWDDVVKKEDVLGRLSRKWEDSAEQKRMWARVNRDLALENSKKQWKVQEAKNRSEYAEYLAAFQERFPDRRPIGFDRFRKVYRRRWLKDHDDVLNVVTYTPPPSM